MSYNDYLAFLKGKISSFIFAIFQLYYLMMFEIMSMTVVVNPKKKKKKKIIMLMVLFHVYDRCMIPFLFIVLFVCFFIYQHRFRKSLVFPSHTICMLYAFGVKSFVVCLQ